MIITMRFLLMRSSYQHWRKHWWIIIFKQNFTVANWSVTVQWLLNERMAKFRLRAPCQKITLEYEIYCMAILQLFRYYWSTLPHQYGKKYFFFINFRNGIMARLVPSEFDWNWYHQMENSNDDPPAYATNNSVNPNSTAIEEKKGKYTRNRPPALHLRSIETADQRVPTLPQNYEAPTLPGRRFK